MAETISAETNNPKSILPNPDIWSKPFWDYAKKGFLGLQKCSECAYFRYPPGPACPKCLSALFSWEMTSGRGKVISWVIFHQSYYPGSTFLPPYNVAIVELAEGPVVIGNIVEIKNDEIHTGLPVEASFRVLNEAFSLPQFRPSGGNASV